jgi:hypothetical protein
VSDRQPDPLEAACLAGLKAADRPTLVEDAAVIARHVRPLLEERIRKAYAEGIVWERSLNRAAVARSARPI